MLCSKFFRGGANNVGKRFDLEHWDVVGGSCGLSAWFHASQLLILLKIWEFPKIGGP